ncbi:MAG: DUF2855 family protein [Oceanococcus sp.]
MTSNTHFEVSRTNYAETRLHKSSLAELPSGSVRLRVERFSLTANTVTYAVAGDLLGYWNFFPAEPGWGRVPAMGWGEVIATNNPDIAVGGRYYGWFPMSATVDFAASANSEGFRDDGPHRQKHAPIYRAYTRTERDPLYQEGQDAEDRHALLRGLFQTAFLADDFLAEQDYFGARQVLILSASSKTAIALAELVEQRDGIKAIAITSTKNMGFVRELGCYSSVLSYADIATLNKDEDCVLVDMSGDTAILDQIHRHFGPALKHSMAIGRSHHDAPRQPIGGDIQPSFFFAPLQGKKRVKEWGAEVYGKRVGKALFNCVSRSQHWLHIEEHLGSSAVESAWSQLLAGQVRPSNGIIASLHDASS